MPESTGAYPLPGPRAVFEWSGAQEGDGLLGVEIAPRANESGIGEVWITVQEASDPEWQEITEPTVQVRFQIDVTNADRLRDALDQAARWVETHAEEWS
jgi:hypothetical protein